MDMHWEYKSVDVFRRRESVLRTQQSAECYTGNAEGRRKDERESRVLTTRFFWLRIVGAPWAPRRLGHSILIGKRAEGV